MGVFLRTSRRCACFLGGAEEEVSLHFVERGVVRVLHRNNTALLMVDTGDGAHLHPARVWDVGAGPNDGIAGTRGVSPPPPTPWG